MIPFPSIESIKNPGLLEKAKTLDPSGILMRIDPNYTYLKIDDAWIHELFPCLMETSTIKPKYFDNPKLGAHISVIYPEEKTILDKEALLIKHPFQIIDLAKAFLASKEYIIIKIDSSSLRTLRKKHGLNDKHLLFKGYYVPFHITIAIKKDTAEKIRI